MSQNYLSLHKLATMSESSKNVKVTVTLTAQQAQILDELAKARAMQPTDYLRYLISEAYVQAKKPA